MTSIFDVPGSNPPNPFLPLIEALITSPTSSSLVNSTAAQIVTNITDSPDPAQALWELWDAFFIAVAASPSHAPHLALLKAIRAQSPTQPTGIPPRSEAARLLRSYTGPGGKLCWSTLPRFDAQWRDTHDILQQWRDWDGVRPSGERTALSGAEYYLNFCTFSAAQLKQMTENGGKAPAMDVFYTCKEVLERKSPEKYNPKPHRMTPEEIWALDIHVTGIWVRDGGRALWEMDEGEKRKHWGAALDEETELWPRNDGLTKERWRLWEHRLQELSRNGEKLEEETRRVLGEAAEVIAGLLEESST